MAVSNSLVNANKKVPMSVYLTGDAVKNKINEMIGGKEGQKFISAVTSAVSVNPALQECSNASILSAALLGQSLNLSPSPQLGYYYMVPYDTKNGKVASFQIGWRGELQLAERSGFYEKINVVAIKEGELVKFDPIEETIEVNLIEDEETRENAPTIGYYAFFKYTNGFKKAIYWSKAKMMNHAKKYSRGYANDLAKGTAYTFWSKNFDDMACKTMLRQLIGKYGIMSIEMQTGYEADGKVLDEKGNGKYVDNPESADFDETIVESVPVEENVKEGETK